MLHFLFVNYIVSQVSDMTHFYFNKNSVSDLLLTNTIYYRTQIECN